MVNWGILGAGNISGQFVHDLLVNNTEGGAHQHVIVSVGSSQVQKGEEFIKKQGITPESNHGVTAVSQTYDDFFANPDVEVVYIGTPHSFHRDQVIQALNNDKHVLVEKPMTINGDEARELFDLAKKKNKFIMEAVWTRFFPSIQKLKKHIFEDKTIGDVHRLFVDFGFDMGIKKIPPTSRIRDVNLGGGATLDIGIYPVTYARILLDNDVGKQAAKFEAKSLLTVDPIDHVDHISSIILRYENGKQGILTSSNWTTGRKMFLRLEGTDGVVEMWSHNPACPKNFKISFYDDREPIVFEEKNNYNGFIYEANAVADDIAAGRIENATMPWAESLLVMDLLDTARKESGLVYPQDKK